MSFIKLYDAEVMGLANAVDKANGKSKSISGDAWSVYCALRMHAWVDKLHRERGYWTFPSQILIAKDLDWVDQQSFELSRQEKARISNAVKVLVRGNLIKVHRSEPDILKERAKVDGTDLDAMRIINAEYHTSKSVRAKLRRWKRMKAHSKHNQVYELRLLRWVEDTKLSLAAQKTTQIEQETIPDAEKTITNTNELKVDELELEVHINIEEERENIEWNLSTDTLVDVKEYLKKFVGQDATTILITIGCDGLMEEVRDKLRVLPNRTKWEQQILDLITRNKS